MLAATRCVVARHPARIGAERCGESSPPCAPVPRGTLRASVTRQRVRHLVAHAITRATTASAIITPAPIIGASTASITAALPRSA